MRKCKIPKWLIEIFNHVDDGRSSKIDQAKAAMDGKMQLRISTTKLCRCLSTSGYH